MLRLLLKSCKQVADGLTSGVQLAPKPLVLYTFNSQKVVDKWHVFTDSFFGGKSQATFLYNEQEQAAEFSGRCTLDQQEDADMKRAGYCVASSKVEYIADYFDLSGCSHIIYNVKGDGRTYIANIRVDSMAGTGGDVWQAPFRPSAGQWSTVRIPVTDLALTYQGQLVERKIEFQADKVISVGVSVSASSPTESTTTCITSSSRDNSADSSHTTEQEAGGVDNDASSSSSNSSITATQVDSIEEQPDSSQRKPHELFRLLIRDIRAEGEL